MDGLVNGLIDGLIDGWNGLMDGMIVGLMNEWIDRQMEGLYALYVAKCKCSYNHGPELLGMVIQ